MTVWAASQDWPVNLVFEEDEVSEVMDMLARIAMNGGLFVEELITSEGEYAKIAINFGATGSFSVSNRRPGRAHPSMDMPLSVERLRTMLGNPLNKPHQD